MSSPPSKTTRIRRIRRLGLSRREQLTSTIRPRQTESWRNPSRSIKSIRLSLLRASASLYGEHDCTIHHHQNWCKYGKRSKLPLWAKRCEKGCVQSTRQSHLTCILCRIQHASLKLHIVNLSTTLIPYSVRVYPKVSYSYTVHTGTYRCIYIHASSKASGT